MKLYMSSDAEGTTIIEIEDDGGYRPDVLADWLRLGRDTLDAERIATGVWEGVVNGDDLGDEDDD